MVKGTNEDTKSRVLCGPEVSGKCWPDNGSALVPLLLIPVVISRTICTKERYVRMAFRQSQQGNTFGTWIGRWRGCSVELGGLQWIVISKILWRVYRYTNKII